MYKKITYLFYFLCLTQLSEAQEVAPKKTHTGFTIGGNFNRMTTKSQNNANSNLNFNFNNNPFITERSWKIQYQSGLFIGVFGRRRLSSFISLQSEFNAVWCRQKTQVEDVPIPNPNFNINNGFFGSQATKAIKGSIDFNNIYWQIPLIANFQIDKATIFEAGVFFKNTMTNNSTQDLTVTTFSEFSPNTGRITVFDLPRVTKNTARPEINSGLGWLLGLDYTINPRFSVRLRYEGGLTDVAGFGDLRENRMTVGILYHNR